MAYDEGLAQRIREALSGRRDVTERHMFGGLAFLVGGHMACGVVADQLMARVGPDAYAEALRRPHAREMDFTGRPMRGMVFVGAPGVATRGLLEGWIERCLAFVLGLPPKDAELR